MLRAGILAFLSAASVSATACTTSESPLDITRPTYEWGQLVVDVRVNGDPTSSNTGFDLFVDRQYADSAILNGRRSLTLLAGDHRISIVSAPDWFTDGEPSWCFASEDSAIVHIGKDSTSTLVLGINCPPFAGSARIRIHGAATGANAPSEVSYEFLRWHPWQQDGQSITTRIPVGGLQELSGVPGIYVITPIDQTGKCVPWWSELVFDIWIPVASAYVLVRDGQVVDVNNALDCP